MPAQVKRLNSYCRARGWSVGGEYVDSGASGRDVRRQAYQRMMEEREKWDVLVVLKMDRIHRNSKNFTAMMDDLRDWGKEFNSTQEAFDTTTAMGRFVMDIIQRIAQLESEQIGERVKIGMTQKATKGKGYLGFGDPYGYEFDCNGLTPIESELDVIRETYDLYLSGHSLQQIADILNSRGIRTKKGRTWMRETVSHILSNPLYCGFIKWDGIVKKAVHTPVVSIKTFSAVQTMMEHRTRNADMRSNWRRLCVEGVEAIG
ncbi:MAG: recombinase family protein [Methanomassiliicoccales archaeon]|nr:recombinase family protein [Methanomassiliicoccales archaeon]